jgi:hypothetical protein
MDPAMIQLYIQAGGLGLAFFMTWKGLEALNSNTRVLSRIEGFLQGEGMKPGSDSKLKKGA